MPTEKRIDWAAIRAEYIAGGSYRVLAQKYGTNKDVIARKAKAENWLKDRETARDKAASKSIQKTANAAASNAVKIERAKGMLIDRIIRAIEQMPMNGGTHSRQYIQEGNKKLTVDYSLLDLITALEKLSKEDVVADDPLMRLLGDLDEQSGV